MIQLSIAAQDKLASVLKDNPDLSAVRMGVEGGGCSGFQYHMSLGPCERWPADYETAWNLYTFGDLKVYVDPMSEMYLDGVTVDYIDTIPESGFKFTNPNVKTACGCGKSFSV
jgi:iron-sulfur cluster assembly accessory protein